MRAAVTFAIALACAAPGVASADDSARWHHARGFSFTFGSLPADGVTLTGATLEYTRRYGNTLARAEYTYGVLENELGADHANGIMHRGELSVRVPLFGVGPRYGDGFKPGTFFLEGGVGHHWNRWRGGAADSSFDATASFGMMLTGGDGGRAMLGTSKVKLIVARTHDGPDVICATSGSSGCTDGPDGELGVGVMATWGISLGN